MTGSLALLAAAVFAVVAIRVNDRTTPQVTGATWIALLWMLHSVAKSLEYWFGGGMSTAALSSVVTDQELSTGSPLDRALLTVLIFLAATVLMSRRHRLKGSFRGDRYVLWLFAYMAISVLWSDYPSVSAKRWIRAFGDLLVVLVFFTEEDPFDSLTKTLRDLAYLAIPFSVVLVKYFRPIGVSYTYDGLMEMWVGVTPHKNVLGQVVAIGAVVIVHDLLNRSARPRVFVGLLCLSMCMWLLAGSATATSQTALVMFIVGVAMVLLGRIGKAKSRLRFWLLAFSVAVACVSAILVLAFRSSFTARMTVLLGREATLTGRTDLWEALLRIASGSRLLGRGYGGFWIGNPGHGLWSTFLWRPGSGHNGYLDVYLDLGLVGVALLGGTVLGAYKHIRVYLGIHYTNALLRLTLLTLVLLNNASESGLLRGNDFLWTLFLALVLRYPGGGGEALWSRKTDRFVPWIQREGFSVGSDAPELTPD